MRSMPVLALSKYSFEPLGCSLLSLGSNMQRREFITLLGGTAVAMPIAVHAQEPVKMLRVGAVTGQPRNSSFWQPFEQRMTELGYEDGFSS